MGLPGTLAIMATIVIMVINHSTSVTLHPRVDGFTQMEWINVWVMMHSKGKLCQEHFVRSGMGAVYCPEYKSNPWTLWHGWYFQSDESLWSILDMSDCQEPREQASVTMDDDKKIFKYVALFWGKRYFIGYLWAQITPKINIDLLLCRAWKHNPNDLRNNQKHFSSYPKLVH